MQGMKPLGYVAHRRARFNIPPSLATSLLPRR